jgi:hypothetical protein
MLKCLAILVVFFALTQKPLPLNGSQKQEQTQTKAPDTQPPAPPPITSEVGKENAANAERYAYYKARPKEYLKAAIAPANASNWVLAGLGFVGGILGLLTLLSIKRQTDIIVDKERARLRIEMVALDYEWPKGLSVGPTVQFDILCYGSTEAFIESKDVWCDILDSETPSPHGIGYLMELPNAVTAKATIPRQNVFIWPCLNGDVLQDVKDRRRFVHCYGLIRYQDVFGKKRETGFYYIWQTIKRPPSPAFDLNFWQKVKCKGYNRET